MLSVVKGHFPNTIPPIDISPTDSSRIDSAPKDSFLNGHYAEWTFPWITFLLFIEIFIYHWYINVAEANEFQKYVYNNTSKTLNTAVKLIYLQINHPQSILPIFLTLVLNLKTELVNLISGGRLFHTREPWKWTTYVP